uniref:CSON001979 protein n=1 Tax=Culicoides sonorensis TaxID=179676 RepID=A0A336K8U8_CULSO
MLKSNLRQFTNKITNQILLRNLSAQVSAEVEWKNVKPFKDIPSPGLSLVLKMLPGGDLRDSSISHLHRYFRKTYGNIAFLKGILGAPNFVFTYDVNDFEKVFRTEGIWPYRPPMQTMDYYRNKLRRDVYKVNGLLDRGGEKWQEMRTVVNPVLMQPKVVDLYVEGIDEVTRDMVKLTKSIRDAKDETPPDFGRYIERWSLESIGTVALDTRLGVLQPSANNKGDRLAKAVDEMFELGFKLEVMPSLIESQKEPKPVEQQGVLEKLLKVDRNIAIVMSMDMLAVGVDTTSSAVKALLFLLAKNPARQEKLRKEILEILPTKDTPLTAEKLKHLPYLRACMKEAHRVFPVVAGTVRATTQDMVIQGYQVPKGTWVAMAGQLFLEDDEFFTKAKEFIPERWLKDDSHKAEGCKHAKEAHPFAYLPFGFGPPMCVGRRFAELEIATFIIRFVREFDIRWNYPDLKVKSTFIETLVGDMKFELKDLKN